MITCTASQSHRFATISSLCAPVHVLFSPPRPSIYWRPLARCRSRVLDGLLVSTSAQLPAAFHPGVPPSATLPLQQLLCNVSFSYTDSLCRRSADAHPRLALDFDIHSFPARKPSSPISTSRIRSQSNVPHRTIRLPRILFPSSRVCVFDRRLNHGCRYKLSALGPPWLVLPGTLLSTVNLVRASGKKSLRPRSTTRPARPEGCAQAHQGRSHSGPKDFSVKEKSALLADIECNIGFCTKRKGQPSGKSTRSSARSSAARPKNGRRALRRRTGGSTSITSTMKSYSGS